EAGNGCARIDEPRPGCRANREVVAFQDYFAGGQEVPSHILQPANRSWSIGLVPANEHESVHTRRLQLALPPDTARLVLKSDLPLVVGFPEGPFNRVQDIVEFDDQNVLVAFFGENLLLPFLADGRILGIV